MARRPTGLSHLAGLGFVQLQSAEENLRELAALGAAELSESLSKSANPDAALTQLLELYHNHPKQLKSILQDPAASLRLVLLLGASEALAQFLARHPKALEIFFSEPNLPSESELDLAFANSQGVSDIRVTYRKLLTAIAIYDLSSPSPLQDLDKVAAALADLAGACIDAGLALARREFASAESKIQYLPDELAGTRLAVIGMGKCGARELNYISDVDVIYVAEASGIDSTKALEIATKLATRMMRIMDEPAIEPPLWQVDANLRPEGKSGALVRTLESHINYYDRWAESWEFQALLKARPIAGDRELAEQYLEKLWPKVWESATRENFVESVQRMRERVTENIPDSEIDSQIKLGPGGLRDVEFTVQLLQLVHGRVDHSVRVRDTISGLRALGAAGYIGRADAERFEGHYRFLRFLEHRIQLSRLRRTHLMPSSDEARRALARNLSMTADQLIEKWELVKLAVRDLHQQLFYRPLLSAVSGLSEEDLELTSEQAQARLRAIGFVDPKGALSHITALTSGLSRRAAIQRQLLPVLLQWFSEGTDPDAALLAFRRLSEDLGESHWYLRMLRDSSGAAKRMTQVFSNSRLATDLFEKIPEAAAWFDREAELEPLSSEELLSQFEAIQLRHEDLESAATSIKAIRRRETLRIAIGAVLGILTLEQIAKGLTDLTESYLVAMLKLARESAAGEIGSLNHSMVIVAMGRFGGSEMGFGSDADVMVVYSPTGGDVNQSQTEAEKVVSELRRLSKDQALQFELDLDLRPEGKKGPIVRSIDSYAAYYQRWSGTWESQALLRARVIAGDSTLSAKFVKLIDQYRYPSEIASSALVEIRRIKARVEVERLPQGADPKRHLKLGRGSLSDVEWLVQLYQLKFAHTNPEVQTPHTLQALGELEKAGIIAGSDAQVLSEAWRISSRVRSAAMLYLNKQTDVLPADRKQLEGIARLLGYPRGGASALEEDYLATTRRGRAVFERLFFD